MRSAADNGNPGAQRREPNRRGDGCQTPAGAPARSLDARAPNPLPSKHSERQSVVIAMKLTRETGDGVYRIRSFNPGELTVNETVYHSGVVLSLTQLHHPWSVEDVSTLATSDLQPALDLDPEIILLGTGPTQCFPPREVMRDIVHHQVGLEVMDTASACRTFNVLMAEGRRIVAALVV